MTLVEYNINSSVNYKFTSHKLALSPRWLTLVLHTIKKQAFLLTLLRNANFIRHTTIKRFLSYSGILFSFD